MLAIMRNVSIVQIFYPLSLPSGAWSIATIKVILRTENGYTGQQYVYESYRSPDKKMEQCLCFALCLTLV